MPHIYGGYYGLSVAIFGIGVGINVVYKNYTKSVTLATKDELEPELIELIKKKTSLNPMCTSYSMPVNVHNATPKLIAESMFSSWVIAPEQFILWLLLRSYKPLPITEGKSVFGMFKVEVDNPEKVVLHWELGGLAGLHVFLVKNNVAVFDTIFWYAKDPPSLLLNFHDVYSETLLAAAVKQLEKSP